MVNIQHSEGTKSKVIYTTNSHRVALLVVENERIVIDLQDNISNNVNVKETGGNSGVVINKVDVTYGTLMSPSLGEVNQGFAP